MLSKIIYCIVYDSIQYKVLCQRLLTFNVTFFEHYNVNQKYWMCYLCESIIFYKNHHKSLSQTK